MEQNPCSHLAALKTLKHPKAPVCEECIKTNDTWVHLRTCQTCGVTLCCDSSENQHMSKHALAEKHPVMISAEPGERWLWCFVDEIMAEY